MTDFSDISLLFTLFTRPKGIEPLSQASEAYVISIGPRAHVSKKRSKGYYMSPLHKKQYRKPLQYILLKLFEQLLNVREILVIINV